mmetsp:Transcript_11635/g.45235  ORF Transcript_11635/g.45235 Transcript_11635/m.45235 type:complete len:226 (+) Transcript_11635:2148-2825(+)
MLRLLRPLRAVRLPRVGVQRAAALSPVLVLLPGRPGARGRHAGGAGRHGGAPLLRHRAALAPGPQHVLRDGHVRRRPADPLPVRGRGVCHRVRGRKGVAAPVLQAAAGDGRIARSALAQPHAAGGDPALRRHHHRLQRPEPPLLALHLRQVCGEQRGNLRRELVPRAAPPRGHSLGLDNALPARERHRSGRPAPPLPPVLAHPLPHNRPLREPDHKLLQGLLLRP